jgi:putative transposase
MTNHVHFIVEPGDDAGTVSELIKRLAGRQAAFVNKQERRNSALWEGRFKASPIQRANMVVEQGQYRW